MSQHSNDTYRYYLRDIVKKVGIENAPMVFGAEKNCYIFHKFVIFFQNIPKDASYDYINNMLMTKLIRQQHAQYLHNCGIQVPKILDIQATQKQIVEIQEKAPGEVLFYTNESNILNLFADKNAKQIPTSFKDMGETYRDEFCQMLSLRNADMQKKLKNAPIAHFVKFLQDFKALEEYGFDLDLHGENFLYSPKHGFTFIDLPNQQSSQSKKFDSHTIAHTSLLFNDKTIKKIDKFRDVPHSKILYDACKLLADSCKYAGHVHDLSLVEKLKKNNSALLEKLFATSKLAGYQISDTEYEQIKKMCSKFCHTSQQSQNEFHM